MLFSKIKRPKWDDDYVKYIFFHARSERSNHEPSAQYMFCYILNRAISFWHIQNCRLIYKKTAFIQTSPRIFSSTSTNICAFKQ